MYPESCKSATRSKNMKPLWKVKGFFNRTSWKMFQTAFLREKLGKSDTDMYKDTDMCMYIFIYTFIYV